MGVLQKYISEQKYSFVPAISPECLSTDRARLQAQRLVASVSKSEAAVIEAAVEEGWSKFTTGVPSGSFVGIEEECRRTWLGMEYFNIVEETLKVKISARVAWEVAMTLCLRKNGDNCLPCFRRH